MELYFQEHDISHDDGPQSSRSQPSLALRFAASLAALYAAEGPEEDRLREQVRALLADLTDGDPTMSGTPAASKEAIRTLPYVNVRRTEKATLPTCPICTDQFQLQERARKLPCGHIYHDDCILPWLKHHCTCPMCRTELPTDNREYEEEKKRQKRQAAVTSMQSFMYS